MWQRRNQKETDNTFPSRGLTPPHHPPNLINTATDAAKGFDFSLIWRVWHWAGRRDQRRSGSGTSVQANSNNKVVIVKKKKKKKACIWRLSLEWRVEGGFHQNKKCLLLFSDDINVEAGQDQRCDCAVRRALSCLLDFNPVAIRWKQVAEKLPPPSTLSGLCHPSNSAHCDGNGKV